MFLFFFFLFSLKRHEQGGFYGFFEKIIPFIFFSQSISTVSHLTSFHICWFFFIIVSSTSESPASCLFSFIEILPGVVVFSLLSPSLVIKETSASEKKKKTKNKPTRKPHDYKVSDSFLTHNIYMCLSPSLETFKVDECMQKRRNRNDAPIRNQGESRRQSVKLTLVVVAKNKPHLGYTLNKGDIH